MGLHFREKVSRFHEVREHSSVPIAGLYRDFSVTAPSRPILHPIHHSAQHAEPPVPRIHSRHPAVEGTVFRPVSYEVSGGGIVGIRRQYEFFPVPVPVFEIRPIARDGKFRYLRIDRDGHVDGIFSNFYPAHGQGSDTWVPNKCTELPVPA